MGAGVEALPFETLMSIVDGWVPSTLPYMFTMHSAEFHLLKCHASTYELPQQILAQDRYYEVRTWPMPKTFLTVFLYIPTLGTITEHLILMRMPIIIYVNKCDNILYLLRPYTEANVILKILFSLSSIV